MAKELIVDDPYSGAIVYQRGYHDFPAVEARLDAARIAQKTWRHVPLAERIALIERVVEQFTASSTAYAHAISQSMGKPLAQAENEVRGMADRARKMCAIAEASLAPHVLPEKPGFERWISREPVGVVAVLAAWNYPLLIAINPIVAALLAGNAVLLKHSSRTPVVGDQFEAAFAAAGAPSGLLSALHLNHADTERLVQHPAIGYVSFTGSVAGGRQIYQAVAKSRFIDVALELGGKDPAYVASDAKFDFAVEELADGAFYNAGQSCCGIERIYVAAEIYPRFVEALAAKAAQLRIGPPEANTTNLGPMAQPGAPTFLLQQVAEAKQLGARIVCGGQTLSHEGQGRFFAPTVVADTDHRMAIAREESFGPVVAVASVKNDAEAVARMNDSAYGLTASVWTEDLDRGRRLLQELDAGTVFLNRADYLDPHLAWTGVKDSGKGASLSYLGFLAVTRPKSFHLRLPKT